MEASKSPKTGFSQVLYLEPAGLRGTQNRHSRRGGQPRKAWSHAVLAAFIRTKAWIISHCNIDLRGLRKKDFTGEVFGPQYLASQGEVRPVSKGEPNGLESTKNRRSAGRHGNQHVCVRRPQV